jgi:tetratricopeptide (TPR) repeat protein
MAVWPKTRPERRVFFELCAPAAVLLMALATAGWALAPGLAGGFLFDDFPNLEPLGHYGGVVDWNGVRAYLASGFAGPTGRPLALASFLIDANDWPAHPYGFKRTNLLLHLLNGLALTWATLKLAQLFGLPQRRALWLAVLNGSVWLLHPLLVSSTYYVVQRMAMLSATFSFFALAAYWHGRALLPRQPRAALSFMGASLVIGTALATLSKENGVLLPLLALVVEACLPARTPQLPAWFLRVFLLLPSAAVLAYLFSQIDLSPQPWPHRPFNQIERALTQARILWEYLAWWFWPRIEGAGLFQDGYTISRSLWDPPTTLPALLGIAALAIAAILLRQRWPWFAIAVLFFLTGHVLESTWLGLELYFEHRNYLPSAFLALPLAAWLAAPQMRLRVRIAAAAAIFATLAFLTHARATLWGDPIRLEVYWAMVAPHTPRSATTLARHALANTGDAARARGLLDAALAKHPDNGLLVLSRLQLAIQLGQADPEAFAEAARRLVHAPLDPQAVLALRQVVRILTRADTPVLYRQWMQPVFDSLESNPAYGHTPMTMRLIAYLRAQLALADGRPDEAEALFRHALARYGSVDAAMQMVADMGNAGHSGHALRLLALAQEMLRNDASRDLPFERAVYEREIERIRQVLLDEITRRPARPASS